MRNETIDICFTVRYRW